MIWVATVWSIFWVLIFINGLSWGRLQQIERGYKTSYVALMYAWILAPWVFV